MTDTDIALRTFNRFADLLINSSNALTQQAVDTMGLNLIRERLGLINPCYRSYVMQRDELYVQQMNDDVFAEIVQRNNQVELAYNNAIALLHARGDVLEPQQRQEQQPQAAIYQLQPAREPHITNLMVHQHSGHYSENYSKQK